MHRLSAALAVLTLVAGAGACGGEGSSAATRSTRLPPETTQVPVSSTASPTPPPTTAATRTVALGKTFTIEVGESVSVPGTGLAVTFGAVVSDSRCPPGVMCIQAGNAVVSVTVAKPGMAPANLTLNTTEGPKSARYGANTVELVQLVRGPVAGLRVT